MQDYFPNIDNRYFACSGVTVSFIPQSLSVASHLNIVYRLVDSAVACTKSLIGIHSLSSLFKSLLSISSTPSFTTFISLVVIYTISGFFQASCSSTFNLSFTLPTDNQVFSAISLWVSSGSLRRIVATLDMFFFLSQRII
jgi:hypothetical protein